MNIKPFRYPGGKGKMLPVLMKYIEKIHKNTLPFSDAFVGGGSVALEVANKYPDSYIYLNDKDYLIYSFWDVVAGKETDKLSDLIKLIDQPVTLENFYKLKEEVTSDKLRCAYKAIFLNRTTFSGILKSGPIGGKDQNSKYTVDCRYNANKLKKKIIACNKLLQGRTTVTNHDILDLFNYIDNNTTIYLDPPYVKAGKALYSEYMSEQEHIKMRDILVHKNKWILSYDDSDIIREIYSNCSIHDTSGNYSINGVKAQWSKKNELIIIPKI
tara:strand:+ start:3497 stop:4306 length:810 start_codon:yes stop_codon:yes gene_type:complete